MCMCCVGACVCVSCVVCVGAFCVCVVCMCCVHVACVLYIGGGFCILCIGGEGVDFVYCVLGVRGCYLRAFCA